MRRRRRKQKEEFLHHPLEGEVVTFEPPETSHYFELANIIGLIKQPKTITEKQYETALAVNKFDEEVVVNMTLWDHLLILYREVFPSNKIEPTKLYSPGELKKLKEKIVTERKKQHSVNISYKIELLIQEINNLIGSILEDPNVDEGLFELFSLLKKRVDGLATNDDNCSLDILPKKKHIAPGYSFGLKPLSESCDVDSPNLHGKAQAVVAIKIKNRQRLPTTTLGRKKSARSLDRKGVSNTPDVDDPILFLPNKVTPRIDEEVTKMIALFIRASHSIVEPVSFRFGPNNSPQVGTLRQVLEVLKNLHLGSEFYTRVTEDMRRESNLGLRPIPFTQNHILSGERTLLSAAAKGVFLKVGSRETLKTRFKTPENLINKIEDMLLISFDEHYQSLRKQVVKLINVIFEQSKKEMNLAGKDFDEEMLYMNISAVYSTWLGMALHQYQVQINDVLTDYLDDLNRKDKFWDFDYSKS